MLTPEQIAAIHARLNGEDSGATNDGPAVEEQPKEEVTQQPAQEKPEEKVEQPAREEVPAQPPAEKLVPLSEVVKLRGERRALKDNLAKLEREVAELRGYVQGSKTKPKDDDQSWIDELAATEDDKKPDELAEIREYIAEKKREEGRSLLNQVIAAVKEAVPNIDDNFLIDEIANGRTPQQAVTKWQQYASKFAPPPQQATPPQVQVQAQAQAPKAPPTVAKATTAGASSTKPTSWDSVQQAVRQKLTSR